MKRRPVKREVPPILEKEIFYVLLPAKQKKELEESIEEHGGLVASTLNKKVTHLIMRDSDVAKKKKEMDKAKEWKIPVVTPEFVEKCASALDVVDDTEYRLDEQDEEEEEEEEKEKEASPKPSTKANDTDNKRKAEPDKNGSSSQPEKKKAKVETASSAADVYLLPKSCFSGISEQEGFDPCPFMLTVLEREDDEFSGQIVWATLQTTTKFKGSIDGDTITIEEYELVSGDDVEVPNKYTGTIEDNGSLKGKLVDSHNEEGTFELKNISLPKETYKDNFRQNTIWKGICYNPYPFSLHIEKRQKNSFTGTLSWPTIADSKTRVRGTISDGKFEFEEYEVIKGVDEIDVPNTFSATISDDSTSVEGTFIAVGSSDPGRFAFQLQPAAK